MMGEAMLKRHQFVWSLWALYRLVVSSITWGVRRSPCYVPNLGLGESFPEMHKKSSAAPSQTKNQSI